MRTHPFVIDTDVHHSIPTREALFPYLAEWEKERFREFGASHTTNPYYNNGGFRGRRADTFIEGAQDAGGALPKLQAQLLEECQVDIAILTGSSAYEASNIPDVDYGSAICRAFNEYTKEHWLERDDRLRYAMAINHQDPAGAAKEIQRLAGNDQVVGVLMPTGAPKPFGNRFYDPIYRACEEAGLTPVLHLGTEGIGLAGATTATGWPSYYIESRLARAGCYSAHLASYIFEGTLEKFPRLNLVFVECGLAWIPPFLWRADADWKGLRYQTPWVKKLPSEYVSERIRFNTQPLEEPPRKGDLVTVLDWLMADRTVMFGSDYPHWDFDHPQNSLKQLNPSLRQRIFSENAKTAFPRLVSLDTTLPTT